jgi:small subunit ribosomal protein S13
MKKSNYNNFFKQSNNKNLITQLNTISGLNFKSYKKIILLNGLKPNSKLSSNLLENSNLKLQIEYFFNLEKNKIFLNIEKKKKIKNYKGMRHLLRLPVRGQRTHTNAKTPRTNIKKEI